MVDAFQNLENGNTSFSDQEKPIKCDSSVQLNVNQNMNEDNTGHIDNSNLNLKTSTSFDNTNQIDHLESINLSEAYARPESETESNSGNKVEDNQTKNYLAASTHLNIQHNEYSKESTSEMIKIANANNVDGSHGDPISDAPNKSFATIQTTAHSTTPQNNILTALLTSNSKNFSYSDHLSYLKNDVEGALVNKNIVDDNLLVGNNNRIVNLCEISKDNSDSVNATSHNCAQTESLEERLKCGKDLAEAQSTSEVVISSSTVTKPTSPMPVNSLGQKIEMDNRKVEPIKINLHNREPIKTVIKIPHNDEISSAPAQHSPKIKLKSSHHQRDSEPLSLLPIPKFTIKNATDEAFVEVRPTLEQSHLSVNSVAGDETTIQTVPKITIRGVNSSNCINPDSSNTVPKFTIKSNQNSKEKDCDSIQGPSRSLHILEDGVRLTIKPIPEPPLPKLTIKTSDSNSIGGTGNTNQVHYIANSISPVANQPKVNKKLINAKPNEHQHQNPTIPKITIKAIPNAGNDVDGNILTIENRSYSTSSNNSYSSNSSNSNSSSDDAPAMSISSNSITTSVRITESTSHPTVPKLVVRVPKDDYNSMEVDSSNSHGNEIPKLVIKKSSPLITSSTVPSISNESSPSSYSSSDMLAIDEDENNLIVPKLTIRQVKSGLNDDQQDEQIVIPKVTIKPIIDPNNDNELENHMQALVTPKITIKPIPKPVDITQPLEIVTNTSKFNDGEQQNSPRIILKINKDNQGNQEVTIKNDSNNDHHVSSLNNMDDEIDSETITAEVVKKAKLDRSAKSIEVTTKENERPRRRKKQILYDETKSNVVTRKNQKLSRSSVIAADNGIILQDNSSSSSSFPTDLVNKALHPLTDNIILTSDGSSSDCIVVEDNGIDNGNTEDSTDKDAEGDLKKLQEASVDRDSGVDVSNPLKLPVDEVPGELVTPIKRPRGRPRKDGTPAGSVKKIPSQQRSQKKRQFASVANVTTDAVNTKKADAQNEDRTNNVFGESQSSTEVKSDVTPSGLNEMTEEGGSDITAEAKTETVTPIVKQRRPRIIPDDDDESPTFHPLHPSGLKRAKTKGARGRGRLSKSPRKNNNQLLPPSTGERIKSVFMSPEAKDIHRRKLNSVDLMASAPQVFEEDTRMSADFLHTPSRFSTDVFHNDESQSSVVSSMSASAGGTNESSVKKKPKMELVDPDALEFSVDMIAEYDWPPPKGCCPSKNRDAYMIQEQIAEYLGVKSFKRKYPDLPRRTVEMEERNYLMEKGLVSEKMCDLGLTAVLASDVLDIMCNDFYDKFELYKKYLQERQIRDSSLRHKALQQDKVVRTGHIRDIAMHSASSWNMHFNRERKEDRRQCLDLQSLVVQMPENKRMKMTSTVNAISKPTHYPVALVPGQFQEYYRSYSSQELFCLPINTVMLDPASIETEEAKRLFSKEIYGDSDSSDSSSDDDDGDDSSSSSDSDDSSDDDSSDSDSSCSTADNEVSSNDKNILNNCKICLEPQNKNRDGRPELFITCVSCKHKVHPTCIDMPPRMVNRVLNYEWQCTDCKHCMKCVEAGNEDKLLFCDQCDRGYHIYCIGLSDVPSERWHCELCSICSSCGCRSPEGHPNPNLTAQQKQLLIATSRWTHEYRINHVTNLREHYAMLCSNCVSVSSNINRLNP